MGSKVGGEVDGKVGGEVGGEIGGRVGGKISGKGGGEGGGKGADLEIGHPRFRALGGALRRARLGQHFFAALAALRPKGALDLGCPSKNVQLP